VVHRCLSCAWSVFGSVILNQWFVCVRYDGLFHPVVLYTHTCTNHWFKITLPNTEQAHDKHQ